MEELSDNEGIEMKWDDTAAPSMIDERSRKAAIS